MKFINKIKRFENLEVIMNSMLFLYCATSGIPLKTKKLPFCFSFLFNVDYLFNIDYYMIALIFDLLTDLRDFLYTHIVTVFFV